MEIEPWNGSAPRWVVSRGGAVAIVGLLFLVPSAVFGLMMWQGIAVAQSAALGGLLGGLIGMAVVALFYWPRATEPVDAAWELVVPALLDDPERPFGPAHSAFLASLARVSCGRGDTRHRQPMLKRAIQTVHHLVRQGALPARHLAELWHLRLDDAMQSERVHGPREAVVRELLSQLLHGDGSADHATHGGTVLMRLRRDELLALVWHLAAEARSVGLVPGDLVALAKKSSTIAALLTATSVSPKALACFFAILELEEAREVPPEICTTRSLLSQARHRLLEKHALLLARSRLPGLSPVSDRDAIWLTVEGLVFRGHTFTSLPDIRTIELTQYIQISGQYQTQVIGHQLTVGKQSWTCRSQPTALAAELRQLAVFRFQKLLLKAEAWSQRSPTSHLARILAEPLSRCPHCGAVLRLRKGMLAERTTTAVAD